MAIAPFFNKALLAASRILKGVDPDGVRALLEGKCVAVAFDDDAISTPEGRWIAELSVNLAARLYPSLTIAAEGEQATAFGTELRALAVGINPVIDFRPIEEASALLSIGQRHWADVKIPVVYAGAHGWQALVSHCSPRSLSDGNPFGAGAAACLAAAQIFRTLFAEYFSPFVHEEVCFSLLDYQVNGDVQPSVGTECLCDSVVLCGAGAIGNAALWALLRSQATGSLTVVDPEAVEESNLQRYILTDTDSVMRSKVQIVEERSAGSLLEIIPFLGTWGEFVTERHPLRFSLVATALDTAEARIETQASLPREIVNAWTQTGDLGVSRHNFLGDQACLACLYLSDKIRKNEDQIIAEALGFDASPNSAPLMAVRNALYSNASVDENWILQIASALNVERGTLEPFLGRPLRTLYQEGICGGSILATKIGAVEVPMAFQSAMAGIMLAAEIVKNRRGISADWVTTKVNLLRPIGAFLSERQEKSRFGNCFCQDEDFIGAYNAKFSAKGNTTAA